MPGEKIIVRDIKNLTLYVEQKYSSIEFELSYLKLFIKFKF